MQPIASKILIGLIAAVILIGGGLLWWYVASTGQIGTPTIQTQTTQSSSGTNNQTTVTTQGVPTQTTTQTQQVPIDINAAYAALFPQILGTQVAFVQATATSTGDMGALYKLYTSNIAANQKMYPNSASSIDIALVDLTEDSKPEAIVYENLLSFCGSGGCTIDVYKKVGNTWTNIFSTAGGGVVGLSNTLTSGYLDLYLTVGAGDTVDRYMWNGSTYQYKEVMASWNGSLFMPLQ